jgi:Zn-dependent metalloprotease
MRKIYAFAVPALLCFSAPILAQQQFNGAEAANVHPAAKTVLINKQSRVASFIVFRPDSKIPAAGIFEELRAPLHMEMADGWQLKKKSGDNLGFTHSRYTQTFNGIPVEGGEYIVHERNGRVESVNGMWMDGITVNTTPAISEADALQDAMDYTGAQVYRWQIAQEEARIRAIKNDVNATWFPTGKLIVVCNNNDIYKKDYRLAWKFDIFAAQPFSRQYVFVDAQTGAIILAKERVHTADVNGTANTMYSGTQTIVCDNFSGNQHRLRETGRGQGIQTFNLAQNTNYNAAVDFLNTSATWTSTANDDHAAYDAHWGAEKTYDYYVNEQNRDGLDDNGMLMLSFVHYDTGYNNAFWDGTEMTYGDGNGNPGGFNPLTAIDVCGHEFTHGVTEFTANLDYQDESGALNESFSDIFGTAIEYYAKPATANFLMGEQITVTANTALRSMSNPNAYGDPDCYTGTNWYTGTADNGGVHTNSGVQNFWFYLLCQGGSGTNDLADAYTVTGIGIGSAADIAFRNLTVYLTSTSEYDDARTYAIQSAQDLFGACTPEVIATTNAWYACGVGSVFSAVVSASFVSDITAACTLPLTVNFTNNSINAANATWHFGDNTSSTQYSPSHTYTQPGTYNISLAVNSNCGSDSIAQSSYITINTPPAPTSANVSSCASSAFTLNASGTGTLNWYTSPTSTVPVGTGNSFVTPVLSNTTTYYVENAIPQPPGNVGPVNNNFGTGGQHNNTSTQYLEFTVLQPCTLLTALVNAGSAGNKTFTVWDSQGNQLNQYIVNVPGTGAQTITMNIPFQPGSYRIGGTQMNLYRNNSGASFPYSLSGAINITGSSAGSAYYYYLYNWQIGLPPCTSERTSVVCTVGALDITFTTADYDTVCVETPPFALTGGLPAGGTYSGPAVSGGLFNPGQAVIGLNAVTYTYTDSTNCTGTITRNIFVDNCLGLPDGNMSTSVSVYPNPAGSQFMLELGLSQPEAVSVSLVNLLGQEVYVSKTLQPSGLSYMTISTVTMPRGVYLLRVQTSSGIKVQKVELR